ncbi:hypothetical protein EGW08_000224 [Elysia chlorotica]|uniref:Uncharacterized protein n=1 Tax=Elysia chlorotica TaxID=188477 RepID=A0A433UDT1_ELYCH|nr:hypothetical protein EGW08_000224 [Elysia chlorotica]
MSHKILLLTNFSLCLPINNPSVYKKLFKDSSDELSWLLRVHSQHYSGYIADRPQDYRLTISFAAPHKIVQVLQTCVNLSYEFVHRPTSRGRNQTTFFNDRGF